MLKVHDLAFTSGTGVSEESYSDIYYRLSRNLFTGVYRELNNVPVMEFLNGTFNFMDGKGTRIKSAVLNLAFDKVIVCFP